MVTVDKGLPDDFAERIAELMVNGVTVGYLQPTPVELYSKKHPPRQGVDLDVVLIASDGEWTTIDFAIPEIESFQERASSGELSLNDQMYALQWLDEAETARVRQRYFTA